MYVPRLEFYLWNNSSHIPYVKYILSVKLNVKCTYILNEKWMWNKQETWLFSINCHTRIYLTFTTLRVHKMRIENLKCWMSFTSQPFDISTKFWLHWSNIAGNLERAPSSNPLPTKSIILNLSVVFRVRESLSTFRTLSNRYYETLHDVHQKIIKNDYTWQNTDNNTKIDETSSVPIVA